MEKEFLKLIPKRFLCPYCGEWHKWTELHELGYYDGIKHKTNLECSNASIGCNKGNYRISFWNGYCYYTTERQCRRARLELDGGLPVREIAESVSEPTVTFKVPFKPYSDVGSEHCSDCKLMHVCNVVNLADKGNTQNMEITLGFEFEQSDYDTLYKRAILARKERELQVRENAVDSKEKDLVERQFKAQQKNKEETIMAEAEKKKTSIRNVIYEKSPKENLETLRVWAEKYKPTLKWAIPVVAVYGAYRILNSDEFDLSVNNIAETCEKKLGFKVKALENKKALKELMVIGGLSAGAYGAMKAVSGIFGIKEEKDISVEEVEAGMSKLEAMSKKFAWIQPKTEDMLPVAFSVIFVYVTLHKPKFIEKAKKKLCVLTGDFQIKFNTYIELAKLFIQDKFNMDLSKEDEQKKLKICVFLIALCGVFAFLYGKKVLVDKKVKEELEPDKEEVNESVVSFIEQAKVIIEKIAPTVYTTLVTMLVSKKLLAQEDVPGLPKGEDKNEAPEEKESAGTNKEEENPETDSEE